MMSAETRNRIRLLTRDLAAGAAFGSMAVSGQIPVWATVVFCVGLLLAVLRLRLLAGRGVITAIVLALGGLGLYGGVATGRFDLVVAACTFSGFITLHRLLSEPLPATDSQVYLTSLLMIAGGAALSGELLFALFLMLFAALASVSLGLSVVEDAIPEGAQIPLRPLLRQLSWGVLAAMLGSAAFFVLFPRLSWNVAGRRVSPGLGTATSGFSDRVRLGGDGSIKKNPRIVLRAKLFPDPGKSQLDAYWIGKTYDSFKGDEWSGQGEVRRASVQVKLRPTARRPIHQMIELLPAYGARTLVALDPPVLFGNATAHSTSGNSRTQLVEIEGEEIRFETPALGYSYHAYSLPSGSADESSPDDADPYVGLPSRYLSLPPKLDPRVAQLARQVVGNETDRLKAAHKLEAYLKANYGYTLDLSGDVEDPLADFLFVRKEGHCEHFATALTVMLRTLKIPARVAGGFFGGERIGDEYVLRAGDAHAWTQVLIPGRGFVTLDATPEASRPGQPSRILEWLTRQYEALDALWRSGVVDYSINDQAELARALIKPPRSTGRDDGLHLPSAKKVVGALLLGLAGWLVYRLLRYRPPTRRERAAGEATALLDSVERLLAQAHVPRDGGEGVEELSARLSAQGHPLSKPLAHVTRRYLEARFGNRPLEEGERDQLVSAMRRAVSRMNTRPESRT